MVVKNFQKNGTVGWLVGLMSSYGKGLDGGGVALGPNGAWVMYSGSLLEDGFYCSEHFPLSDT